MAQFKRPYVSKDKLPTAVLAKWGFEVLGEGFVPFPKKLIRALPSLFKENGIEKLQVVLAIIDFIRDDQKSNPSKEYLAFVAGMPVERFSQVLGELKAEELLEVVGSDDAMIASPNGLKAAILNITKD